jgi:hypothetical protein
MGRWVGLGLALVGFLPPLVPLTLSRKRLLSYVSLVSSAYFCIHINSTGTSENRLEAYVYVCIDVYFSPFWAYVPCINLSIMTANRPWDLMVSLFFSIRFSRILLRVI